MTLASLLTIITTTTVALLGTPGPAHAADAAVDQALKKTLNSLVGSIRYGKDDLAAKQLAFDVMARELLADDYAKLTPAEQTEVASGLETIVRALSFPKGRDMFKYLDALLLDPARVEGDRARVKTTVVVHRDLKKSEIILEWVLVKQNGTWKVLDTVMLGESTLTGLRNEQVLPLLKQGGTAAVMKALRDKVAEVRKA